MMKAMMVCTDNAWEWVSGGKDVQLKRQSTNEIMEQFVINYKQLRLNLRTFCPK